MKDWRRRYFILKGSKLFFAKVRAARAARRDRRSASFHFRAALRFSRAQTENSTPHGMIDLASCMTVKSAEYKAHKRNALEVSTPDTTFLMFADTEKEKDDWYARRVSRARARAACAQNARPSLLSPGSAPSAAPSCAARARSRTTMAWRTARRTTMIESPTGGARLAACD